MKIFYIMTLAIYILLIAIILHTDEIELRVILSLCGVLFSFYAFEVWKDEILKKRDTKIKGKYDLINLDEDEVKEVRKRLF